MSRVGRAGQGRVSRHGLCGGPALAVPPGRVSREGKERPPGPLARLPLPCWRPRRAGGGGALFPPRRRVPPSLPPPPRPPAVPPVGPSLRLFPPSRPASFAPAPAAACGDVCVSSAISPFARLSQCRSPLAPAPSPGAPAAPSLGLALLGSHPAPPRSTPPPGVVLSGAPPPSHLVFASRPPTCHWRRDVWESPAPRPPGPACPGAEVSHGRGAAGAGGQGGKEGGKQGGGRWPRRPRGPTGRRAQLPLLLSPAPRSRRHLTGPASEGRRWAGQAGDPRLGPRSGEGTTATDPGPATEPTQPQVRRWRRFFEPSETSKSLPEGGLGGAGAPACRGWGPREGWESRCVSSPALASPHRVCVGAPELLIPG